MAWIRSRNPAALLAAAALLVTAAPAHAKAPGAGAGPVKDIRVTPKRPKATDTITVSFVAGKIRRDQRYEVSLAGSPPAAGAAPVCSGGYAVRTRGVARRGQRIVVTLNPNDSRGWPIGTSRPGAGRFCPAVGRILIGRVDAEDNRALAGSRAVTIVEDAGYPPPLGTPVKITVLDGSSITIQVTGRPDRTLGVGGLVRGTIPGLFRPNTDIGVGSMVGGLFLRTFQVDAICAGANFATELPLAPAGGSSNLLLKAGGEGVWTLALAVDPLSLAGCTAPAAPATTTLTLTGKVTPDGLARLPLTGSVTGVPVAAGITGTVTVSLLVNVDLSGQG